MADDSDIALSPYAQRLGIELAGYEDGTPILKVEFGKSVEGRPQFFHGGATSGLLEKAAYAALKLQLQAQARHAVLKPVNFTVQFLAAGTTTTAYAKAHIMRLGRRNANVTVEAWQKDRTRPIAMAVLNILLAEVEG